MSRTITDATLDGADLTITFNGTVNAADFTAAQVTGTGFEGAFDFTGPPMQASPTSIRLALGGGDPQPPATITITGHPELTNPVAFPLVIP